MSVLDPEGVMRTLEDRVTEKVGSFFPLVGKKHSLIARKVYPGTEVDVDDVHDQKRARIRGKTWSVPIYGDLDLVDTATGKVVDTAQGVKLLNLPKLTRRYSYVVEGKEYQSDNQWRLKAGAYTRQKANGELETQFNLAKGRGFRMGFRPSNRQFLMSYGTTNIPLLPVLQALGVPDADIRKDWGEQVYAAGVGAKSRGQMIKLAKVLDPRAAVTTDADAIPVIREVLGNTVLNEETTRITLGQPFDKVTGGSLLAAANKLLGVSRGTAEVDNRDSLRFKELWSIEDHLPERLQNSGRRIRAKLLNNLDRKDKVRHVVTTDVFNVPIKAFFTSTSLAQQTSQVNPVDMVGGFLRTTIMGAGGISSENAVSLDAKMIDSSHLGFLDPVHTPEGCFHPDMEVFTRKGWVAWPAVDHNTVFACLVDGAQEWHKPEDLHVYDYDDLLFGCRTPNVEYLVSRGHRLWVAPLDARPSGEFKYRFELPEQVQLKSRALDISPHVWEGGSSAPFLPPDGGLADPKCKRVPEVAGDVWAAFMGWFLSEGSRSGTEDGGSYGVVIHQNEREVANCTAIEAVLTSLGYGWTVGRRDDGKLSYRVSSKQVFNSLADQGLSWEKFIPEELLVASLSSREALFEALLAGDGRTCSNHGSPQRVYCTTSPELASGFERLAFTLGYACSVRRYTDEREERYHDVYEVRVLKTTRAFVETRHSPYYTTPYKGKVYCATVPGSLLYVRMPGKRGHWSGNSRSGVAGHLSLGVSKRGVEPTIRVFDTASKTYVQRTPGELALKNVAFADQYVFNRGKDPSPRFAQTTVIPADSDDPRMVDHSEVGYILQSPKTVFSMTANLVPFLASDQANRAGMATRHMEQAISLKAREEPLVQTVSGNPAEQYGTWEKILGGMNAHVSPISGKVTSITSDTIMIEGDDGKPRKLQLYENFPLNDKKAFLDSTPLVKEGDRVEKGQVVADTNFTRNGVLAIGTNLRVGFLAYKGLVFEDGIVISETAAKKLSSEHLYKERSYLDREMHLGLKKFRANYPGVVSDENAAKLDADGVVKKGEIVRQGDVIMTILQKTEPSSEQIMLRGIHKSLARPWKNKSLVWDKPYDGIVTEVVRNGKEIQAFVRTEEEADIGDKLSGRHGNKGVITAVLADEEMPRDREGKPLEIIVNPSGVPGRINLGQVLETSLAKVADKQGSPYAVDNFQPTDSRKIIHVKGHWRKVVREGGAVDRTWVDPHDREVGYHRLVQNEMERAKVSETDELFDPDTKKSLGKVLVGKQYFLKLMHQVDKKSTARAHGYGNAYDQNLQPKGGGSTAAQRFGELGYYAMLAHGSTANLREAATYKGDKQQDEVWAAIQTGSPLPTPVPSFAYEKFLAYMNAVGLNVEKNGNDLVVKPFTDEQILDRSNGKLSDPSKVVRGKDLRPEKGGLFDEEITGGPGGKNWSHIELATRIPNPIFEKAILALLGLRGVDYDSVIEGRAGFDKDGKLIDAADADVLGPAAITKRLKELDVAKELAAAEADLITANKTGLDRANKKVKYLRALQRLGMTPDKAYTIGNIPVLPPIFRPVSAMEGGDLNIDGVNMLYRDVALINSQLEKVEGVLPDEEVSSLRKDLYHAVDALMGVSPATQERPEDALKPPGILTILSGRATPKNSYFQDKLMDRAQDLSMRSIIVPDMTLGLDELGLPRKGAMKIFRPFVIRELVRMGHTPLQARDEVERRTSLANKALDVVVSRRPVLFKRDPVLHKFGVMAFMPRLHDELTIHIHPLVTGGFNADFDGDAMAVFVPVSQEAVDEAKRMLPSQNLFNPATGKVMYQPSNEGQLGLYLMTQMGKDVGKTFATQESLIAAADKGEVLATDIVTVAGKRTTAGRVAFNRALPLAMRSDKYLTDPEFVVGDKNLQKVMKELATSHPGDFVQAIDRIKNLGFDHSYSTGFSFDLKDFDTLTHIRDKELKVAGVAAEKIRADKSLSADERDRQLVKVYTKATLDMSAEARLHLGKTGNKLFAMHKAGVKPGWAQLQQMVLSPMLLENARGRVIPVPVTKSYAEGLDTSGYWVASSGARKGLVDRVLQTQKPGALSKQIINTVVPYVITSQDCGTTVGLALDIGDSDVVDRFTAKDTLLVGGKTIPAGTLITPTVVSAMKAGKLSRVVVRSPLKCEAAKGMCAKCYGLLDGGAPVSIGTNIGVVAGQAIGERGTQLSMKTFHSGGLAGTAGSVVGGIDRVSELLKMPAVLPNIATISHASGVVGQVEKSPVGGWDVHVGDETHYVPARRELLVKSGDKVRRGQALSSGAIDPRELLEQTNVDTVQRYISDEIHTIYEKEGIKRRNIEVVTKALTNLGKVEHPGDSDQFIRGDYVSISNANAWNKAHPTLRPIDVTPTLRGMGTLPLDQSEDWMARMQYQKLRETLVRSANENWKSDLHGLHPTPGVAYGAEFGRPGEGGAGPY